MAQAQPGLAVAREPKLEAERQRELSRLDANMEQSMPSVACCVVSEPLDLSGARSEAVSDNWRSGLARRQPSVLGRVRTMDRDRAPINALFLPHGPPDRPCNRKLAICVGGSRLMQKRSPVAVASDQEKNSVRPLVPNVWNF